MPHPVLQKAWSAGRPAFGGWVTINADTVVSAIERAGYDFVGFDCQHGAINETEAANMIRRMASASCATIVRVSENSPALIGRVLDAGADGIIVPLVNNAEEAARAAAACNYPPDGVRSFGPSRPGLPTTTGELYSRTSCFIMIETKDGIANAEEICAVPGVSGVVVGPADLSIGLGLEPYAAFTTDQLYGPLRDLRTACERNGVILGIFSGGGANAAEWIGQGCRMVVVGGDVQLLFKSFTSELAVARGDGKFPTASPKTPYA
jgi:4-hydroxy-2-oxoheptanedioate aldolase